MTQEEFDRQRKTAGGLLREHFGFNIAPDYSTDHKKFEGINAVCTEIDACDNLIRLNKIKRFKVRPFKKEMSLSHLQFITEYLTEKENHLKTKK